LTHPRIDMIALVVSLLARRITGAVERLGKLAVACQT
jgi:hypothetical protein